MSRPRVRITRICEVAESCLLMYPLSTVAFRLYTTQFVGNPSTLWSRLLGILNLKSHSWYPALILCAFVLLSELDTGKSVRVSTRKLVFCVIGCGLTVLVKCHLSRDISLRSVCTLRHKVWRTRLCASL
jgi:hypothetical protein